MTPRVVGIDFSLTSTGIAWIRDDATAEATTATSTGKRADTLTQRHHRLRRLTLDVLDYARGATLAVIESPELLIRGASPTDRHGGWWFIVSALLTRDIPVAVITPTALKLAIAGSGRADKAAVAIAVERLWPGLDVSSSDVSDATALAHLGAVHLGWDVPTLERHRAVKAAWPELPDPTSNGAVA